jgi:hypothetical protein
MSLPHFLKDFGFRALNKTHRTIVHARHGRIGASAFGMPAVELFTVGRKSGHTQGGTLVIESSILTVGLA